MSGRTGWLKVCEFSGDIPMTCLLYFGVLFWKPVCPGDQTIMPEPELFTEFYSHWSQRIKSIISLPADMHRKMRALAANTLVYWPQSSLLDRGLAPYSLPVQRGASLLDMSSFFSPLPFPSLPSGQIAAICLPCCHKELVRSACY